MTDQDLKPLDFSGLRQLAIDHAQKASGQIWTDYNLHDPGVTLLEQTCFALTELSYQTTNITRDLLTGADGVLDFPGLALFAPTEVLPGRPVTDLDLSAEIAEAPQVARVLLAKSTRQGLYNMTVIPAADTRTPDPEQQNRIARAEAQAAFHRNRPLACDLGRVSVAARRETGLRGEVQVFPSVQPERVAAEVYYHVAAILRGQEDGGQELKDGAATRANVYDAPETFLHAPTDQDGEVPDLESHLSILRAIPGVAQIGNLSLFDLPTQADAAPDPKETFYRDLQLPTTDAEIGLTLTLNGIPLELNPNQIREEYIRVAANHISRAQHHLDEADWAVMTPGRRRDSSLAHVDALLPALYRAAAQREHPDRRSRDGEDTSLGRYRSAIDTHLVSMSRSLEDLPVFFDVDTGKDTPDPVLHRQRLAVLDYLIALQGEEMPPTQHSRLHLYRSRSQRRDFEINWRIDYLNALPWLNAGRGTGPRAHQPGGFLGKLMRLVDLPIASAQPVESARAMSLSLAPDAALAGTAISWESLTPYSDIPNQDPSITPLDLAELMATSPWIENGRTTAELLMRAARPDAFVVARDHTGTRFSVLFEPGDGRPAIRCAERGIKREASQLADRIRASWRAALPDAPTPDLCAPMAALGLSLDQAAPVPDPDIARDDLIPAESPFDMLVRRDDAADILPGDALIKAAPWIAAGKTTPTLFHRSARPVNFIVAATAQGGPYHVLFDSDHPTHLYCCATRRHKSQATDVANQLRASWRALHEACEGGYLVEDILLRGRTQDFAPHFATLVLTGWTARMSRPAYRSYLCDILDRLAPAHLVIRPLWLTDAEMARFEAIRAEVGRETDGAAAVLRKMLKTFAMRRRFRKVLRQSVTRKRAQFEALQARLDALRPAADTPRPGHAK